MATKKALLRQELERITKEKGILTAEFVVEEARQPGSLLHDFFDWDDMSASEAWRIHQARMLIKSVKVEIIEGEQTDRFFNVKVHVNNVATRGYFKAEDVMSEKELRTQVIENALRELEYWQRKYNHLQELATLVDSGKLKELKNA